MEPSDSRIILFPDFVRLRDEVQKLRTELSMRILERDELVYVECKNLETAYMLALGGLEYKVYEQQCAVLRLKRKVEMIQAKKNRQEKVIVSDIDRTLDAEFSEYQKSLNERIEKMNAAIARSKCDCLTDDETAELKKLYRKVVKALHPDLHPDQTEARATLFLNAVSAYESGNLNEMRLIGEMVSEPSLSDENASGMEKLAKEKKHLTVLLKDLDERIAEIKRQYPYTMKSLLHNESAIKQAKME